ncbi:unnamed protein product [Adineta ricciae]|uniref:Uncharacterized protein n=1 Tax=Adineta ricciae TaxID=249248 RepID=A0A814S2C1_ADIRI|nr:unnamed protein product [Adineta ricciae]CAF1547965.1 unnamed protein product [Adineta ricciae]
MPFVTALEHAEVRLHNVYKYQSSVFSPKFLQKRQEWPTNVISLRFIAYDQFMDTTSFCEFVKRFSLSLEHLSFYMRTHRRFLMSTPCTFEQHLLNYLSRLKHIEFCVYNGVGNTKSDRRTAFDSWTKMQVVSVYHWRKFNIRFTLPSIVMIIFHSGSALSLALFTLLNDDLIQDTKLTLPNVTELCLKNVTFRIDYLVLRRIFSLAPCIKHLIANQHNIQITIVGYHS